MPTTDRYESFPYKGKTFIFKTTIAKDRSKKEPHRKYATEVYSERKFFGYNFVFDFTSMDIPDVEQVRLKLVCWMMTHDRVEV